MKLVNDLDFQNALVEYTNLINQKLSSYLDKSFCLYEQMYYCVMNGAKRIRPLLLLSVCSDKNDALPFACAIEFIHNYSLIHDDLPAMDNDTYRRNQLTCHKKFGEANAILTGDALLNLACEIIIDKCLEQNNQKYLRAAKKIFNAAGINGMIKGQVLDIESENININENQLKQIHLNKTSALIRASLEAGIILDDASESLIKKISELGNKIGLAFQIKDDIFDCDEEKNKATYVSMYGLEKTNTIFNNIVHEIYLDIKNLNGNYNFFKDLVKYIMNRKN